MSVIRQKDDENSKRIQNIFELISKWDDPHFLIARDKTREIKEKLKYKKGYDEQEIISEIKYNQDLKRSVILVLNYFQTIEFMIKNNMVATYEIKFHLGGVIVEILERFKFIFKQNSLTIKKLRKS
ncbi:hypothetical protein [Campylobacter sp. CCS1377]|uniref:Uncharacterized protein n=1 Tax=Campylobacter sp. CCS1377 TaxID=3158229 RepID=A0AAU7E798_9BACT|nr:hypothetical protein [Campylobacter jejuni]